MLESEIPPMLPRVEDVQTETPPYYTLYKDIVCNNQGTLNAQDTDNPSEIKCPTNKSTRSSLSLEKATVSNGRFQQDHTTGSRA